MRAYVILDRLTALGRRYVSGDTPGRDRRRARRYTRRRVLAGTGAAVVGIAATAVVGYGVESETPDPIEPPVQTLEPDATYYVVAFHWGWGLFDSEGRELDDIRVPEGTTLEIFAVNDAAADAISRLPAPIAGVISAIDWDGERALREIAEGRLPDPQETFGISLEDLKGAHKDEGGDEGNHDDDAPRDLPAWQTPWLGEKRALETHGFLIPWHGVATKLTPDAREPFRAVFTADRPGAYEFVCTVYCGYGHNSQPRDMLFVGAA